ncbi:class I SAM-dependent methyltransferase [Xinfangfangia pollutisoli]|uniref:class I SAM-dependent methyltransferase n=1 Tax=Xinfangfangia pollutisoli TaxID=2865960 RepID=UPI001CD2321A|nr:class I SAM-dependent methyltransferase [Xinfangfangia pollutisoli]
MSDLSIGATSHERAVTEVFRNSRTGWFRSRAYHEHGVMVPMLRRHVRLETARILDFGCGGLPIASGSFALRYPRAEVVGTDIERPDRDRMEAAFLAQAGMTPPRNLRLEQLAPSTLPAHLGQFDAIYAWSVFEHIPQSEIVTCFRLIRERLAETGVFYFQIGGLYHSYIGSHLGNYLPKGWGHLEHALSEIHDIVFSSAQPEVKKTREWQQFLELNRLGADDFFEAAAEAGLTLLWREDFEDGDPPARLLRNYTAKALRTHEIRGLFKR